MIYKYFDELKAFFSGFWQGFLKGLEPLKQSFSGFINFINSAFSPLISAFNGFISLIKSAFSPFITLFNTIFSNTKATTAELESIKQNGAGLGESLVKAINIILTPLKLILSIFEAIGLIIDIIAIKWQNFTADFKNAINFLKDGIDGVLNVFGDITDKISSGFNGVKDFAGETFNGVKNFFGFKSDEVKPKQINTAGLKSITSNTTQNTATKSQTINDNKQIYITQHTQATPQDTAKALQSFNNYNFGD